jgi:chemotaxis protein methyltransferase CheR
MALNILIINQNEDSCSSLCRFFRSEGHKANCTCAVKRPGCTSVHSVSDKFQESLEERPDIIIIEVVMPESDAIESVKSLHRSQSTKNIPIIVISAIQELEFEFSNIFDFLCKPIDLRRLREDINILAKGGKKRDLPAKQHLQNDDHRKFHDFLIRHSGLHFERRNIKMLERGLDSRMTALRINTYSEYYDYLEQNMAHRQELQKLIQFLTVGETFFFRYHAHFDAVAKNTLVDLMKLPAKKSLRIWSAGCSTGEEPYSLAIAIMEAIPDWKKRDIKIFATDINSSSLKRAKEGVYGSWKMRATPRHYIDKYFHVIGESYLVRDEVKSLVDFSYFNLQSSAPLTSEPFDIIFCRNVMIYFTTATTKKVVEMFAESLSPEGCLYMGHSETLLNVSSKFERHIHDGSFYYRKKTAPVLQPQKLAVITLPPLQGSIKAAGAATHKSTGAAPSPSVKPADSINPDDLFHKGLGFLHQEDYSQAAAAFRALLQIKPQHTGAILAVGQVALAAGRNDEALSCCNEALALNDLLPEGYFLRGLLFEITEKLDDALEEYRKAVLLKIDFVMPHYQLGKLCFRIGDTKTSAREFRNSIKLLEKAVIGAVIPFSGGLSREVFLEQAIKDMAIVESTIANQER